MNDIHVLKILETRNNFDKYSTFIRPVALTKYARQIYKDIGKWYDGDDSLVEVDWESFSEWFRVIQHPTYDIDDLGNYAKLFNRLERLDTDNAQYDQIMKGFIEREYATQMVGWLMEVAEGRLSAKHFTKLQHMLTLYDNDVHRVTAQEDALITDSIEELIEQVVGGKGLDWRLPEMNISAGPLRIGNSILIAAFTNVGKTTFALSEISHMIPQFDEGMECIYFCNEENGRQNKLRCMQAIIGATSQDIIEHPTKVIQAYNDYVETNGEVFKFYWDTRMTTRFIEDTLRQHNPGLIVIDQLWNVEGFQDSGTSTEMYTALAKWVRRIASIAPTMSLHQGDGTTNGQKFLEATQLYGSKVGMQGCMDAIITLGKEVGDTVDKTERGLYIPKNKLQGGPPPFDPTQKDQRWTVYIDESRCLYNSGLM